MNRISVLVQDNNNQFFQKVEAGSTYGVHMSYLIWSDIFMLLRAHVDVSADIGANIKRNTIKDIKNETRR